MCLKVHYVPVLDHNTSSNNTWKWKQKPKKLKLEVYDPVSGAKRHSPDYTQLPPVTGPFIHAPSQLPAEHTGLLPSWCWKLFKHTEAFPVLPGTHLLLGQDSAHVGKGLVQGHNTTAH